MLGPTMEPPAVSIVIATYNRSDVLAHAIRSVNTQTVTDWELLIIGDACTDGTAETVGAFRDERIRFVNRRGNHGEQSAPNNDGLSMARGRFIAFLNHDDLWYPDHLETGLAALERFGADLCYALRATLHPDRSVSIEGSGAIRRGLLLEGVPASTWIYRRELTDRVGPWRSAFELRLAPSQDWLVRALDSRAKIVCTDAISVLVVPSGNRDRAYVYTDPADVDAALRLLDACPERALMESTTRPAQQLRRPVRSVRRGVWSMVKTLIMVARYHPYPVKVVLCNGLGRGTFIRQLRKNRGLPPMPNRGHHG